MKNTIKNSLSTLVQITETDRKKTDKNHSKNDKNHDDKQNKKFSLLVGYCQSFHMEQRHHTKKQDADGLTDSKDYSNRSIKNNAVDNKVSKPINTEESKTVSPKKTSLITKTTRFALEKQKNCKNILKKIAVSNAKNKLPPNSNIVKSSTDKLKKTIKNNHSIGKNRINLTLKQNKKHDFILNQKKYVEKSPVMNNTQNDTKEDSNILSTFTNALDKQSSVMKADDSPRNGLGTSMQRIANHINDAIINGKKHFAIHLNPRHLGSIQVQIDLSNTAPKINLRMNSQSGYHYVSENITDLNCEIQNKNPDITLSILLSETEQGSGNLMHEKNDKNKPKQNSTDFKHLKNSHHSLPPKAKELKSIE